ncbi:hypothetical protein [Fimbriiglobus ruber]|uniref:Uncharacterized protein n=1 Tax=Fimbriiglobus ruber TaxID=1908690 RepID=A0A225DZ28_9BACT|nr:hypothetical protein [Fimbriiglobus ruber]OWK46611.1 hypothetical protein FRUB_00310 [Fimbriiglobus ruber]
MQYETKVAEAKDDTDISDLKVVTEVKVEDGVIVYTYSSLKVNEDGSISVVTEDAK